MNMKNAKWKDDFNAIDEESPSPVSRNHSRAYLRHLVHSKEILGMQITSLQNLSFYLWLVGEARKHIIEGDFASWKAQMVKQVTTRL
jgi:queuine tRNA-ribosyltransferase